MAVRDWTDEEENECRARFGMSCDEAVAERKIEDRRGEEEFLNDPRFSPEEDGSNQGYDSNITTLQAVTVGIPRAEVGHKTAKIVVINEYGESEAVDFTYPNNFCEEISTPTENAPDRADRDLEDAYDECLDDVADLFCEPIESATSASIERFTVTPQDPFEQGTIMVGYTIAIENGPVEFEILLRNRTILGEQENAERPALDEERWSPRSKGVIELVKEKTRDNIGRVSFNNRTFFLPNNCLAGDELDIYISVSAVRSIQGPRTDVKSLIVKRRPAPLSGGQDDEQGVSYSPADDNDFSDGKKELYISTNLVGDINSTIDSYIHSYVRNFSQNQVEKFFPDKMREYYGSFWMRNGTTPETLTWVAEHPDNSFKINSKPNSFIVPSPFIRFWSSDSDRVIKFDESLDLWRSYGERFRQRNLLPSTNFFKDINYTVQKPYTPKEAEKANLLFSSRILDVKTEYNFYNRRYEDIHFNQDEKVLPNMYFLLLNDTSIKTAKTEDEQDDLEIDPDIKKIIRLRDATAEDAEPLRVNSYYDYYVQQVQQSDITSGETYIRSKDLVVPYKFLKNIEVLNERNQSFPMFVDIKFDTSPLQLIGSLMKDGYDGERLYLQIIENFNNTEKSTKVTEEVMYKLQYEEDTTEFLSTTLRYIDFTDAYFSKQETRKDDFIYVGDYRDYQKTPDTYQASGDIQESIKTILSNKSRTFDEILENRKCYTETLFYRIAKYNYVQTQNGEQILEQEPIQNIYIPNDPDKNYLRYIDTQVKYDKKYLYRIYSYDFVIANEYRLNPTNATKIENNIKPLIVENIYDEFSTRVADRPPVPPEVTIKTFKDTDNKILFLLNRGTSTFKAKEQPILDSDSISFEKARETQKLEENELIEFSGDDILEKYQIFRTTKAPSRYEDFSTAELIEVNTQIDRTEPNLRVVASSHLDSLRPNTKYYYTVRCVDIHQQISNPGIVYEVEIINDNDMVFPIIREWKFPEPEQKMPSKSFKRFLMIKPSGQQTFLEIDETAEDDINAFASVPSKIKIGQAEETVWNKTYKLRLVSKNTKKIYDIRFSFDTDKQIIE